MGDVTPLRQHNDHHNHGRRQRKWSPRASEDDLCPAPMRRIDRGQPLEQANMLFVGSEGCMPLKMLLCFGDDAPPLHQSVLRAIHPSLPPESIFACSGGYLRSIRRVGA